MSNLTSIVKSLPSPNKVSKKSDLIGHGQGRRGRRDQVRQDEGVQGSSGARVAELLSLLVRLVPLDVLLLVVVVALGLVLAVVVAAARQVVAVLPLVLQAAAGVHEEVAHRGGLQPQLAGYRHLHLFGGSLGFLDGGSAQVEREGERCVSFGF